MRSLILTLFLTSTFVAQSGFHKNYSESVSRNEADDPVVELKPDQKKQDDDVIRVDTDLVTIPVRVTTRAGRPARPAIGRPTRFRCAQTRYRNSCARNDWRDARGI